jgi:hypothetical protein
MLELRRLCSLTSEDECCSSDTQPLVQWTMILQTDRISWLDHLNAEKNARIWNDSRLAT